MKKLTLFLFFLICFANSHAQLAWLQLANFPGNGMVGTSFFSINGKGYVGLGFTTSVIGTTEMYEYDPAGNSWTQKASLPGGARYGCVSLMINNKGYIISGYKSGLTKEVWEYDPATNMWAQKTNFPGAGRTNAAGFVIGNKGYVGTGYASGTSYTDFYEFDPVANSWTQKASYGGSARNTAGAFSIGNKGYLGMGNATGSISNYNDFYEYDPVANSWTQKADFPITYIDCPSTYSTNTSGFMLCGYYYQTSGITHNPLNTLYKYDPVANDWSLTGTFRGLPRGYAAGFAIGNDMYIGTGSQSNDGDPNLMLRDFWKLSNGMTLMITDPTTGTDLSVYPNPTSSTLFIKGDLLGKKLVSMRLYNSAGQLIKTESIRNNSDAIDVSILSAGNYFIEFITKDNEVLDSRFNKQ
ncbi:hypothetical protein BH11BAC1_BH11BAC1_06730 [soil metagenome]